MTTVSEASGGNDIVSGGAGFDVIGCGADEGSDIVDGGDADNDVLNFEGSNANEAITIAPNGDRVRIVRDPGSVTIDVDNVERLRVDGGDGDDQITASDNLTTVGIVTLTISGGPGHDTVIGSDTNDLISGDAGNDILRGEKGNDRLGGGPGTNSVSGGPGDDTFDWNTNDGNTTILGQDGIDTLFVYGLITSDDLTIAPASSTITPTPGAEFTIRRGTGELATVGGVERPQIRTFEGEDTIAVRFGAAGIDLFVDGGGETDFITVTADALVRVEGEGSFDVLIFDALSRPISVVGSTIAVGGVTRVTHGTIEFVDFLNLLGELPEIDITSPTTGPAATATAPFLKVAGTATDAGGLGSITVVNARGGSSTATVSPAPGAGEFLWTAANVPLAAGANVLTATVRDAAGNEISDTVTVNVSAFTYTMAEGATGSFFDTDILLANPNLVGLENGAPVVKTFPLAPTSRRTVPANTIPEVVGQSFGIVVTFTEPGVAERAMYFGTGLLFSAGHESAGVNAPATTWFLAEGATGSFFTTFVLLANPGTVDATATVTFLPDNGQAVTKTTIVPAGRRVTLNIAIASLARPEDMLRATDFRAARPAVLGDALAHYRIVHFATHGVIDSERPELSGLVLSLVTERGAPQDGMVRLHDIFNMRLNADLVVLSACRTALGKEIRGEGLIGLTRGFMYAGAPRVVASLWQVSDLPTAELMKRFYRGMLQERLRPAAALRAAQLQMSRDPRWAAPYFWAGFVLQGDWQVSGRTLGRSVGRPTMLAMPRRMSRRRFVNGTIRLTVVVPLMRVTPLLAAGQARTQIGDADRRTLRAAADVIIPAQGPMPAASAVGAVGYIERIAAADSAVERLLIDGMRAIEAQAAATQKTRFDRLSFDRQAAVLAHIETTNTPANFFPLLRDLVYEAYYTQPRVQKLIRYQFRSGHRRTAPVAAFDEQLVARIRQRTPFYRQVP